MVNDVSVPSSKNTSIANRVLAERNVNENHTNKTRLKTSMLQKYSEQKAKKRTLYVQKYNQDLITHKIKINLDTGSKEPKNNIKNKKEVQKSLFRHDGNNHISDYSHPQRTLKITNNSAILSNLSMGQTIINSNGINGHTKGYDKPHMSTSSNTNSTSSTPLTDKLLNQSVKRATLFESCPKLTSKNIALLQYKIRKLEKNLLPQCTHIICENFYVLLNLHEKTGACSTYAWEFRCHLFLDMELFDSTKFFKNGNIRQICYFNLIYNHLNDFDTKPSDSSKTKWPVLNTIVDNVDEFPFSTTMMTIPPIDETFLKLKNVKPVQSLSNISIHISSTYENDNEKNASPDQKFNVKSKFVIFPKKTCLSERKNLIKQANKSANFIEYPSSSEKSCFLIKKLSRKPNRSIDDYRS